MHAMIHAAKEAQNCGGTYDYELEKMEARTVRFVRHRNFRRAGNLGRRGRHWRLETIPSHPGHRDQQGRPAVPQAASLESLPPDKDLNGTTHFDKATDLKPGEDK